MKIEFINLLLVINYSIRNIFSNVLEFILVKPLILITPWKNTNNISSSNPQAPPMPDIQYLDLELISHRTLHRLIKFGSKITSFADGIKPTREIRGLLISCMPGTEFIGLRIGKTLSSIEIQGRKYADGSRAWDILWVIQRQKLGKFRVLDVKPEGKSEMKIHCVWVNGDSTGNRFELTTDQSFLLSDDKLIPQYVFGQPTLVSIITILCVIWIPVKELGGKEVFIHLYALVSNFFTN